MKVLHRGNFLYIPFAGKTIIGMEFKSEIVCQELCFSMSSADEKHILITLKWIIETQS